MEPDYTAGRFYCHRPTGSFVDVAANTSGDVFAVENTADGQFGTLVQQFVQAGQVLPTPQQIFTSSNNNYLFPTSICFDPSNNLDLTTLTVSNQCLIDQFGTVYELDSTDSNENLGVFNSPPGKNFSNPPVGTPLFPNGSFVDARDAAERNLRQPLWPRQRR